MMAGYTFEAIQEVPIEFYEQAKRDPVGFARKYGCWPLESLLPFFRDRQSVKDSIENRANPFDGMSFSFDKTFKCGDDFRRYIRVDLGLNRDRCGIAMCHVPKFVSIERTYLEGDKSFVDRRPLPYIYYDFIGVIQGSQDDEIQFDYVIELIHKVSKDLGFDIGMVTYDGWQSISSIQRLRNEGYIAATMSTDRTSNYVVLDINEKNGFKEVSTKGRWIAPWESYRDALLDRRVSVPFYNPKLLTRQNSDITLYEEEAYSLEEDTKRKKVDHPPGGSKDLMDAIVGCAFIAIVNEYGIVEAVSEDTKEERFVSRKDSIKRKAEIIDKESRKFLVNDGSLPDNKGDAFKKSIEDIFSDDDDVVGF